MHCEKERIIHLMCSLPHRHFHCHHAMLLWGGALHDNTKTSCEGDYTTGEETGVHVYYYSECVCMT